MVRVCVSVCVDGIFLIQGKTSRLSYYASALTVPSLMFLSNHSLKTGFRCRWCEIIC